MLKLQTITLKTLNETVKDCNRIIKLKEKFFKDADIFEEKVRFIFEDMCWRVRDYSDSNKIFFFITSDKKEFKLTLDLKTGETELKVYSIRLFN